MPLADLITLASMFMVALWTPGPNNAMLASSGATFGFRRTIPHLLGVGLGFPIMIFLIGVGLGTVFERSAVLKEVLRYAGIALLLWVAWRIANTKPPGTPGARTEPFTFLQACAFQWVNPKAWTMCVSIVAQFVTAENMLVESIIVSITSAVLGLGSAAGWTGFGAMLQRVLARPLYLRIFNISMASILVLGVVYLLRAQF